MSNSNLAVFNFKSSQVRVVFVESETWFIAKDICTVLEVGNVSQALSRLDDDEKGVILNDTPGGKQEMTIVSESGLYSLVLSSRKPEAKAFKKWITSEVLPSIRKTGQFAIATTQTTGDMIVQMALAFKAQEEKLLLLQNKLELESQRTNQIEQLVHQHDGEIDRIFNPDGNYYSIRGYASLKGKSVSLEEAKALGVLASKLSKESGLKIDKLPDPRYGSVNVYSEYVLRKLDI